MLRSTSAGDAAFAVGLRGCRVMLRAVPAMRSARPSASRSTTRPRARTQVQRRASVRTRCSDWNSGRVPAQVLRAGARSTWGRSSRCTLCSPSTADLERRFRIGMVVRLQAQQLLALEVVVPELFARGPEREFQPFLALVQFAVEAPLALALPLPARPREQQRGGREQCVGDQRQRMSPPRRLTWIGTCSEFGFQLPSRLLACTSSTWSPAGSRV